MRLNAGQLPQALKKGLAPVYLLTGEEPLQLGEAADDIRAAAKKHDYSSRIIINIEGNQADWGQLAEQAQTLSLFSDRKLIDLRLPSAKPGSEGGKALARYCDHLAEDTILMISAGKLDAAAQKSQWFQAIERVGVVVQIWPLQGGELMQWLARRAERRGLHLTDDAVKALLERIEGNLLAAAQEIEKLVLRHGPVTVTGDMVIDEVADSSRYDVFKLADAILQGQAQRCAKILTGLQAEGIADAVVLWSISRELRALLAIKIEVQQGRSPQSLYKTYQIWEKRQPLFNQALQRLSLATLKRLLVECANIDRQIKGQAQGDAWQSLLALSIELCRPARPR